jgi:peptidoglycan/LPS O-acetylase OafA/YrhL
MPRLDGLRGIAISGVLAEHFLPERFVVGFSPGNFGVLLFFVLSGYLITRILMQYKDQGTPVKAAAAHFYWRRMLRLGPPYYLAIGVAAAFGILNMRSDWWVHALYLSNIKFAFFGLNGAVHFWTLSVEEQFYLIWFLVIVVLPRRFLMPIILVSIGIPSLYRLTLCLFGMPHAMRILLPGTMDSLATGALIAYAGRSARLAFIDRFFLDRRVLVFSAVAALLFSYKQDYYGPTGLLVWPLTITLLAGCLVRSGAELRKDYLLEWLTWSPLRYLGRISYGVYVYHLFIVALIPLLWPAYNTFEHGKVVIDAVSSIVIAAASYRFMEVPILKFKNRVTGELPCAVSAENNLSKDLFPPLSPIRERATQEVDSTETVARKARW